MGRVLRDELSNIYPPAGMPTPNTEHWFTGEMTINEQRNVIELYMHAFRDPTLPFIFSGYYEVLQLFEMVAIIYGDRRGAWEDTLASLVQFVQRRREFMFDTIAEIPMDVDYEHL